MTQDPLKSAQPAASPYRPTHDPLYFVMLVFFAALTTALPAVIGQPRFLPFSQAVALTIFMAMAVRRGEMGRALVIVGIWCVVQFAVLVALSWVAVGQVERSIGDGFAFRGAIQAWFYGGGEIPLGWRAEPLRNGIELAGVLVGSLLTGGLVGVWFLMRAINLAGYAAGSLLITIREPLALIAVMPWWTLLRAAGYATFVVVLSEPLLAGNWSMRHLLHHRGRMLLAAGLLTALGIVAELVLADFLPRAFA